MAVSVRMDPVLERELALAAKRKGITKSQFVIEAVERALGRPNPYELMIALSAEEQRATYNVNAAAGSNEAPYETKVARAAIVRKLKAKHGARGAG